MRAQTETPEQQRRRVSSRIRNEIRLDTAEDMVEMARTGGLPDQWRTIQELNQLLELKSYWTGHRHPLAGFLTCDTCEDILEKSLDMTICTHPEVWVREADRYKPAYRDWNAYAAEKANILRRQIPTADRTALHAGPEGESILFAHEDFQNNPLARREVDLLRLYLNDARIRELGFGLSADGKTWVMVVWSSDHESLDAALMKAWQTAFSFDSEEAA